MQNPPVPNPADRRRHERFAVTPMYTSVAVRTLDAETFELDGHAYDISEGGLRFELDNPIEPGTPVAMRIDLPRAGFWSTLDKGPGRAVFVMGNVVWCSTEDPGPARMALAITRFAREGDRGRLMRLLTSGRFLRAA